MWIWSYLDSVQVLEPAALGAGEEIASRPGDSHSQLLRFAGTTRCHRRGACRVEVDCLWWKRRHVAGALVWQLIFLAALIAYLYKLSRPNAW